VKVLVVAEHLRGQVQEITFELIAAAQSLGDRVIVALIGDDQASLIDQINLAGVDEVLTIRTQSKEFDSDVYRQAIEIAYQDIEPNVILMGFTINSIEYGAALAAHLELGFASDVFAINREGEEIIVLRAFYGGKVNGELDFPNVNGVLLMLRKGVWQPATGAGDALIKELPLNIEKIRTRHVEFIEAKAENEVDICNAEFLLCVGRGIGEQENLDKFEQLAKKMGATLAVSRPLVDAGWISRARQVGQSGKTVKPKVYLSLGVSGAVQHLAGMKGSDLIISINTDPEASIFGIAHYGAVIDLFEVADELEKLF
jgi:electron transfer flavoprotein alpha subunit